MYFVRKITWVIVFLLCIYIISLKAQSVNNQEDSVLQWFEELANSKIDVESNRHLNEFVSKGNVIITPILERIKSENNPDMLNNLQNRAAEIFEKINTKESKNAISDIVLGRNDIKRNKSSHVMAIFRRIVLNSHDDIQFKLDARELLKFSNNRDFIDRVLSLLPGVPIDPNLLEQLQEYVTSNNYYLRLRAVIILGESPSEEYKQERVQALIKSLQTVEQLSKANERYTPTETGTFADSMYSQISHTLRRMKDKDIDDYLSEATATFAGNPRRWVLTTRARLGEVTVKNEIKEILEDTNMLERTRLRSAAIEGLKKIGTAEDIPFLRNIAENDPVYLLRRRNILSGPILEMIDDKPINNIGERAVIYDEFSIPEWNEAERDYFIRSQAESAIEAIEKRIESR